MTSTKKLSTIAFEKLLRLLKTTRAFTLVELIVVITILAILGTVGFLSLGGYSSNARDSQRSTDVANLSKSLDVSVITVGSYPSPDNSFSVTYSGGVLWYQGTFSTGALSKLGGNGLNKRPLDPLKSSEYAYSVLASGKAYQIKADYEGTVAFNPFVQTAHAAPGNPTVAFVRGNYGGLTAKTETGSVTYVLAVPSIITNTGTGAGGSLEIKSNALSGTLLFNGKNLTGASSFNPTTVVFSGASLPKDDKTGQVTAMMTALKNAYASSDVTSVPAVQTLVNTATGSLATLGTSVIVGQLGGSATNVTVNNRVSGACSGLPSGAAYYNGSSTGYTLMDAAVGTSLLASYNTVAINNTCLFSCASGYNWNGTICNAQGEQVYVTPGTYTWTVPTGVTSVSVVCVGGGGSGEGLVGYGGGGGGLGYRNNIAVTENQGIQVVVGAGANTNANLGSVNGAYGGDSTFNTSSVVGYGGKGSWSVWNGAGYNSYAGAGGGYVGQAGGSGGSAGSGGGGGAGGYAGNGGAGGSSSSNGSNGLGGGGGGGYGTYGTPYAGGGGVGLFGAGTSGVGGAPSTYAGGGSGGGDGSTSSYGGGGYYSRKGGDGACRIIWPGNTRIFPNSAS